MVITIDLIVLALILVLCISGAIYTSYIRGVYRGVQGCLNILRHNKIIRINKAGEIDPY